MRIKGRLTAMAASMAAALSACALPCVADDVCLGLEDFSLYASGDTVAQMEAKASAASYSNNGTNLVGHWSSGGGDASAINGSGALSLNTNGGAVTNSFLSAIASTLGDELTNSIYIATTMTFVPASSFEAALVDGAASGISNGDLKFAIYTYTDGAATNLVVYHGYFDGGVKYYTNEVFATNADLGGEVNAVVTLKTATIDNADVVFFKVSIDGEELPSATRGISDANLAAGSLAAGEGPWFVSVMDANETAAVSYVDFAGTGEVAAISVGHAAHAAPGWSGELPSWTTNAVETATKFNDWFVNHALPVGIDAAALTASNADYSDQYLMNVDATATVLMNIDSIQVFDECSIITVSATADGQPLSLGAESGDGGATTSVSSLNGYLNVTVGSSLATMAPIVVTDDYLRYNNGKAQITIPAKFGSFIKATVDYAASSRSLSD